jgi:predicted DNA-binding transcriptional regulator YafY
MGAYVFSRDPTRRQQVIVSMLSSSGWMSARQVFERLQSQGFDMANIKTVQRDLGALVDEGAIRSDGAKRPLYQRVPSQALATRRPLEPAEAMLLQLAEKHLKHLLPAGMEGAFGDLFTKAREMARREVDSRGRTVKPIARWPDKILVFPETLPRGRPRISPGIYEAVCSALLEGRRLHIEYWARSRGGEGTKDVDPIGLVQMGTQMTLVAQSDEDPPVRRYPLHRMRKAVVLDSRANPDKDFDLSAWAETNMRYPLRDGMVKLSARVHRLALTAIEECPLSPDQKVVKDGMNDWSTVTATVLWSSMLEQWILGQAELLVVLEPPKLRASIVGKLDLVRSLYSADRASGSGH